MGKQNGFTLVELAIVFAVMSILVAVVVPDFIEVAKGNLAERSADEMLSIIDASKWHFLESDPTSSLSTWPGQSGPGANVLGSAAEDCLFGSSTCPSGLPAPLAASFRQNPWGENYVVRVVGDRLIVGSVVPQQVSGLMEAVLPGGLCSSGSNPICSTLWTGGSLPSGTELCCAIVPRPGLEASLASIAATQEMCNDFDGLWQSSTGDCIIPSDRNFGCRRESLVIDTAPTLPHDPELAVSPSNLCDPGEYVRGTYILQKPSCNPGDLPHDCLEFWMECCTGVPGPHPSSPPAPYARYDY